MFFFSLYSIIFLSPFSYLYPDCAERGRVRGREGEGGGGGGGICSSVLEPCSVLVSSHVRRDAAPNFVNLHHQYHSCALPHTQLFSVFINK